MSCTTTYRNIFICRVLIVALTFLYSCSSSPSNQQLKFVDTTIPVYGPYHVVRLPITKGIRILNPIQLSQGPGGELFAANQSGEIYRLIDSDGDGVEDEAALFCNVAEQGLRSPGGFASKGDTIFIGTSEQIRVYLDRNHDGKADTNWIFFNKIPHSDHPYEWTCGMNFGPDGWLYFALSTDSWNAGASPDPSGYRGAILRISPDGKNVERVATGIRSVYGMSFNDTGELFFVDNEGGGNEKEELNRLIKNSFYGHNPKKYPDYKFTTEPEHAFSVEVAPSGMTFNPKENDFGGTGGDLFVSFYGPGERWNRGAVGRIKMKVAPDGKYTYEEQAIADLPKLSGIAFGKDGALYVAHHGVADYWYNSVKDTTGGFFKLIYDEALSKTRYKKRSGNQSQITASSIENGKQLFAEQACSACHAVVPSKELLGPSLLGVGNRLSREEILEEINFPSKIIKPSMGALKITKKDGKVLLGRAVNTDDTQVSIMLVGNNVVSIPRSEIARIQNEKKSLMYEDLIKGLNSAEVNGLLDYITSLK